MNAWYQLKEEEVLRNLNTSGSGLKSGVVADLQKKFGKNILKEAARKSKLSILLAQFKDVMIIILIIAAAISFISGEHKDAIVILAIIIGNAWIGYAQESGAEESVRMLQKMSAQYALVIRDNSPVKIEASELVPGDIMLLQAGDIVPADARLIEIRSFKTEEAPLTGESQSVEKIVEPIPNPGLIPGDQLNMVFKSTMVSNGSAKAVVTATGMNTEIGKIAGMLNIKSQKTPLQKRLAVFSKQLAVIVILICLIVFAFGLWRGEPTFQMFLTSLSLAVAALPEALPAVITIALSKGARRLVKQNALMRDLPAVETLGSVTYICSDKTGTLTQNVMTVEKIKAAPGQEGMLRAAMMLDNEVKFSADGKLIGDSTETALVNYALAHGETKENVDINFPTVAAWPFDSVRMRSSTLHKHGDHWILFVKGAPVRVVEVLSGKYKDQVHVWLDQNRKWAAEGLRVLFFAYKIFEHKPEKSGNDIEKHLDFLGMVAMIDPPREEVIESIRQCKTAGIHTMMITGDQPLTAFAIAKRLQMVDDSSRRAVTGAELEKMGEERLVREIETITVFARVSPEQKLNIVKALQTNGEFVAMTGDGVNDAPSLKQADIGVAMGITGTDVSKESADMILLDDNFATIVKAVKEGRRIYENIRKFILYVLSCNFAEILTIFFAPVFGMVIPLLPIQILWINLVTDGLPGMALTSEPAEKDIMHRPPRPPRENLFAQRMIPRILATGGLMAAGALLTQYWAASRGYDTRTQQTMIFTMLCFVQLGNAITVRSAYHSIFGSRLFDNRDMWFVIILSMALQLCIVYLPFLHPIFKTTSLHGEAIELVIVVSALSVMGIELIKILTNLGLNQNQTAGKKNLAGNNSTKT